MNLTDELQKLAELHRQGHLTDQEFTDAKQKLIYESKLAPSLSQEGEKLPESADPQIPEKYFRSSRWSTSNWLFPDRLTLASDGMLFCKGALSGSTSEHINYRSVASFKVTNGIFLANISIETSGGSQPIFMNGIWKSDAMEIEETIRMFQRHANQACAEFKLLPG